METPRLTPRRSIRVTPADIVAALFMRADLSALKEIGAGAIDDPDTGISLIEDGPERGMEVE